MRYILFAIFDKIFEIYCIYAYIRFSKIVFLVLAILDGLFIIGDFIFYIEERIEKLEEQNKKENEDKY